MAVRSDAAGPKFRALFQVFAIAIVASACGSNGAAVTGPTSAATSPQATAPHTSSPAEPSVTEPSPRGYHRMIEAGDLGVILVGGYFTEGPAGCCSQDAVWTYSTTGGWVDTGLGADELPREMTELLDEAEYDTASRTAVMYSMLGVLTYDPATTHVQPTGSDHPILSSVRMTYDAGSDRVVLFGDGETWSYDVDTDTWVQMDPEVSPPARTWHAMAYDSRMDLVVLYGGFDANDQDLGDTWTYDLDTDTWIEVRTEVDPGPRAYVDMVYVPTIGRTILFGGTTGPFQLEEPHADTWAFDARRGRWTELAPATSPSPRGWHAMAYDATGDVVVLFGGGPSRTGYMGDTWIYDPRVNAWSEEL